MQNDHFSSSGSKLEAPATPLDGITAMRALNSKAQDKALFGPYSRMIDSLKPFLDALAGAHMNQEQAERLAHDLSQWTASLAEHQVPDLERLWGMWPQRPDRGQALVPAVYDDVVIKERPQTTNGSQSESGDLFVMEGKVTFGRFWTGMNNAVHGGAITLLFDEYLGKVASTAELSISRTAYLNTDFRSITPLETELTIRGRVTQVDGRKQFLQGQLLDGERVCAEAHGLWVALKPGQI